MQVQARTPRLLEVTFSTRIANPCVLAKRIYAKSRTGMRDKLSVRGLVRSLAASSMTLSKTSTYQSLNPSAAARGATSGPARRPTINWGLLRFLDREAAPMAPSTRLSRGGVMATAAVARIFHCCHGSAELFAAAAAAVTLALALTHCCPGGRIFPRRGPYPFASNESPYGSQAVLPLSENNL